MSFDWLVGRLAFFGGVGDFESFEVRLRFRYLSRGRVRVPHSVVLTEILRAGHQLASGVFRGDVLSYILKRELSREFEVSSSLAKDCSSHI